MAILSSPSRGDYEKIPILDGPDFGLQVNQRIDGCGPAVMGARVRAGEGLVRRPTARNAIVPTDRVSDLRGSTPWPIPASQDPARDVALLQRPF